MVVSIKCKSGGRVSVESEMPNMPTCQHANMPTCQHATVLHHRPRIYVVPVTLVYLDRGGGAAKGHFHLHHLLCSLRSVHFTVCLLVVIVRNTEFFCCFLFFFFFVVVVVVVLFLLM